MVKRKHIGDCLILVTKCIAIPEAMVITIQKKFQTIINVSNSHMVVISINDKICALKDIINLVKTSKYHSYFLEILE